MAYSFFLAYGGRKVQFPIAPSSLTIGVKGRNETVELLNDGEVNLLKSPGLTEVSFTALIPQVSSYPFAVNNEPIDTYTDFLNDMIKGKTPFQFIVVRTRGDKLLFDTNLKVTCESYDLEESADKGFDVELKINLKQYREYGLKTITLVSVKKNTSTTTSTTTSSTPNTTTTTEASKDSSSRDTQSSSGKTYVVKPDDCLWHIAKKFYGNGSEWKKIYNKNKTVIENTAKKRGLKSSSNGHWIFAGTKLIIP